MRIDLLNEELNIISSGDYGLGYVIGFDISISNDNHFIIVGSAQKPSLCYEEDENSGHRAYILKSPLSTLNLSENTPNPILISPNPSANIINIQNTYYTDEIVINDISEKEIKRFNCDSKESTLDISELDKGIYLIGIRTEKKWSWEKIVKQ